MGSTHGDGITQMFDMVQSGKLKPVVNKNKAYSLTNFAQAFGDLANRRAIGKVIVLVDSCHSRI